MWPVPTVYVRCREGAEAYAIPRQDDVKLRDYPTLGHLIGFVRKYRPDLAAPVSQATAASPHVPVPVPVPVPDLGATAAATTPTDPITDAVFTLVADKTGYPKDMLDLDLDLEADLGIDTVKQAEVFSLVREAYAIPRQDDIKLRDYPTLAHLIGFVRRSRPDLAAAPVPVPVPVPVPDHAGPAASHDRDLLRIPVPTPRPALSACQPTGAALTSGSRVLVVADRGGAGERLIADLRAKGVDVLAASCDDQPADLQERARAWAADAPVAGAYVLTALDPDPPAAELDLPRWRDLHRARVGLAVATARALYDALGRAGSFFVTATRLGGLFGYEPAGASNPSGGAVSGFTKAISRERPEALVKVVDFEASADPVAIALALLAETERDPGAVEIGHRDGDRFSVAVVADGRAPMKLRAPLALTSSTSFLVTGGAGAITTEIVSDLARASGGHFHLLDARPMPDAGATRDIARLASDRDGLRREMVERIKAEGGRGTPVEVERKLFDLERGQAILDALASVERAGGKAFYHQVDVTNADAVAACVRDVEAKSSRVDVILHAAGIERSRGLSDKPQDEWNLVFAVKSDGMWNLLRATEHNPPKAIVGFSSVAGRFGNAGQTDYSAGNDLLCKIASWWGAAHPESLAMVFDWTAWGGIGMATRGSIPEIMKRAGIEMLEPSEAIPIVRESLTRGLSSEAVVGRTLGILVAKRHETGGIDPVALGQPGASGLTFGTPKWDLHQGLRVEIGADPREEPFLSDHEIDGIPVLPGVMGLEAFAQVAALAVPGHGIEAIEDVRFFAPMKYYRREPRSFVVEALPVRAPDGTLRVMTTLSSTRTLPNQPAPQRNVHFTASVVMTQGAPATPRPVVAPKGRDHGTIDRDAIYQVYFHGPAYRVLSDVAGTTHGGVAGSFADDLPADSRRPGNAWTFAPRLVELCFQTAGVWEIGATGQLALPAGADRIVVWSMPEPGSTLVAEAIPREVNGDGPCFDAIVRDPSGQVCVELQGYRTSRLPGQIPEARLAPFRAVVRS